VPGGEIICGVAVGLETKMPSTLIIVDTEKCGAEINVVDIGIALIYGLDFDPVVWVPDKLRSTHWEDLSDIDRVSIPSITPRKKTYEALDSIELGSTPSIPASLPRQTLPLLRFLVRPLLPSLPRSLAFSLS
jgi:hypothetical protein